MTKDIHNAEDIEKLTNYLCPLIIQTTVENRKTIKIQIIYANIQNYKTYAKGKNGR